MEAPRVGTCKETEVRLRMRSGRSADPCRRGGEGGCGRGYLDPGRRHGRCAVGLRDLGYAVTRILWALAGGLCLASVGRRRQADGRAEGTHWSSLTAGPSVAWTAVRGGTDDSFSSSSCDERVTDRRWCPGLAFQGASIVSGRHTGRLLVRPRAPATPHGHEAPARLLAAALAAVALAACAHTREVHLAAGMSAAPLPQVNRHVRDHTVQVAMRDGRLFLGDGMRVRLDSTFWHAPADGTPWAVPTAQIDRVRIDSHWMGIRDGLLIGALVGMPAGALMIDTGSRLGAALAGGYSFGIWGIGIGAFAGGSTSYVFVHGGGP